MDVAAKVVVRAPGPRQGVAATVAAATSRGGNQQPARRHELVATVVAATAVAATSRGGRRGHQVGQSAAAVAAVAAIVAIAAIGAADDSSPVTIAGRRSPSPSSDDRSAAPVTIAVVGMAAAAVIGAAEAAAEAFTVVVTDFFNGDRRQ